MFLPKKQKQKRIKKVANLHKRVKSRKKRKRIKNKVYPIKTEIIGKVIFTPYSPLGQHYYILTPTQRLIHVMCKQMLRLAVGMISFNRGVEETRKELVKFYNG